MIFSCDKEVIVKEISVAQEIISSKNAISILSNVLLEAIGDSLTIKATDLKVSFETTIPVDINSEGSTTVFCDKFLGIIRSMPSGTIYFELGSDEKLTIRTEDSKISFQLKCIEAEKFPELQEISDDSYFELPQKEFINMISQTIFSISDDETRYFMNGVYMEKKENKLILVATDGRRLSYIDKEFEVDLPDFPGIIIPPKILNLIKKLASGEGNLLFSIYEKSVFAKFDNQKIYSTLIDGQFPNYQRVIPEHQEYSVEIDKESFVAALKRVSLLTEQRSRRIYVTFDNNSLVIKSEENEIGAAKEEISCDYSGPESTMALNFIYLLEPLKAMESSTFIMQFTEVSKASSIMSNENDSCFHVIMPMQMD